jgi:hypothetical protein
MVEVIGAFLISVGCLLCGIWAINMLCPDPYKKRRKNDENKNT